MRRHLDSVRRHSDPIHLLMLAGSRQTPDRGRRRPLIVLVRSRSAGGRQWSISLLLPSGGSPSCRRRGSELDAFRRRRRRPDHHPCHRPVRLVAPARRVIRHVFEAVSRPSRLRSWNSAAQPRQCSTQTGRRTCTRARMSSAAAGDAVKCSRRRRLRCVATKYGDLVRWLRTSAPHVMKLYGANICHGTSQ